MRLYIQRQGQVTGPFLIFKIKEMLEDRECEPLDLAWHEGMEAWKPLKEIESLGIFPRINAPVVPEADELAEAGKSLPPIPPPAASPTVAHIVPQVIPQAVPQDGTLGALVPMVASRQAQTWARFGARIFDLALFGSALTGLMVAAGLLEMGNFVFRSWYWAIAPTVVWIFAEAWLLAQFGATPGKLLLGLSVQREDGGRLTYSQALRRSFEVWLMGCGMFFDLICLFAFAFGFSRMRSRGRAFWDESVGSQVLLQNRGPWGIVIVAVAMFAYFGLLTAVAIRAPMPQNLSKEEREVFESLKSMMRPPELEPAGEIKKEGPAPQPEAAPPGTDGDPPASPAPADDKPTPLPTA